MALNKMTAAGYKMRVIRTVKSYKAPLKINGPTVLNRNTILGKNTNFNGLKIYGQGHVSIGDNFHSGIQCTFITENHNYNHGVAIPYDTTCLLKDIIIGDNVWIGSKVIILGGITIGEGAIIQAGSVVSQSIPVGAVAGGNPAQVFKYRDMEHYNNLKSGKKFH